MIDEHDRQINLEYLGQAFLERDRAAEADRLLRQVREGQATIRLDHLLRDHRQGEPIQDEETFQRDAFDFLLGYYGLMEIACLIGYVPEPLPRELADTALANLSQPAMVRYYKEIYPVVLPELFHARLLKKSALREDVGEDPTPVHRLFNEFLSMVTLRRNDEAIDTFLWFLDDGWVGDYNITDTLAVLRQPEELIDRFVKPPPDRNALDLSLRGLQNFVAFCIELDDLLQRSAAYRLFQSAQWYYHAYWFERIREKVGDRINMALDRILHWSPKDKSERESLAAKQAIADYVHKVQGVLDRLLSGKYGDALRERIKESERAAAASSARVNEPSLDSTSRMLIHQMITQYVEASPRLEGEELVKRILQDIRSVAPQLDPQQVNAFIYEDIRARRDQAGAAEWFWKFVNEERAKQGPPRPEQ